jgi:hypothetical protein
LIGNDTFWQHFNYFIHKYKMISRKQSEALRLTVAHYVPILLMMLSTIINYHIRLVKAECCFVMAPSKLQELDYYVNITSQSSLMKNFTRQTASITFPRDYITDREIPSGPNGLICQKDLTDMVQLNRWICAVTNSRTIQVRFRSAMPNSNPPVAQVSMVSA